MKNKINIVFVDVYAKMFYTDELVKKGINYEEGKNLIYDNDISIEYTGFRYDENRFEIFFEPKKEGWKNNELDIGVNHVKHIEIYHD